MTEQTHHLTKVLATSLTLKYLPANAVPPATELDAGTEAAVETAATATELVTGAATDVTVAPLLGMAVATTDVPGTSNERPASVIDIIVTTD